MFPGDSIPSTIQHQPGPDGSQRIGSYRLVKSLGRGGMGIVYLAENVSKSGLVALKILPPDLALSQDRRDRFIAEAKAAASIDHPAIARILDSGESNGVPYIAMEYVEGASLGETLKRAPQRGRRSIRELIDPTSPEPVPATKVESARDVFFREVAQLIEEVARALHTAHARGVLHRDVKPSNILLDRFGRPHLADFGLARIEGGDALTAPGEFLGTPEYASPEQADPTRGEITAASDVYSLGATLYECLTGRTPYGKRNLREARECLKESVPQDPTAIDASVPEPLERIAMRCLEKLPKNRYGSAAALAADLRRYLNGKPVRARGPAIPVRAWRRMRPYRWRLATMACLAAILGLVLWMTIQASGQRVAIARIESRASRKEGLSYFLLDDLPAARARFAKAIENDPDDYLNYALRALTHLALDRGQEARDDLSAAVQRGLDPRFVTIASVRTEPLPAIEHSAVDPDSAFALEFFQGLAFCANREIERALVCFERSAALNNRFAEAHLKIAQVNDSLGRWADAADAAQRYVDLLPKASGQAKVGRSVLAFFKGDFEGAAAELDGLSHSEMTPFTLLMRGRCRHELYQRVRSDVAILERATEDFRNGLRLSPGNSDLKLSLAAALILLGEKTRRAGCLEEAERLVQAELQRDPKDANALYLLGNCRFERQDFKDALSSFQKARDRAPNNPLPRHALAGTHFRLSGMLAARAESEAAAEEFDAAIWECWGLLNSLPPARAAIENRVHSFAELVRDVALYIEYERSRDDAIAFLEFAVARLPAAALHARLGECFLNRCEGSTPHVPADGLASVKQFEEARVQGMDDDPRVNISLLFLYAYREVPGATPEKIRQLAETCLAFDPETLRADTLNDGDRLNFALGVRASGIPDAVEQGTQLAHRFGLDDPETVIPEFRDYVRELLQEEQRSPRPVVKIK